MKRFIIIGELLLIGILILLILTDFTGVGRKNRKAYNQIDHIGTTDSTNLVSVVPLGEEDKMIYHREGDELVPPTPTPTNTPTPTPTLSPEERVIQDAYNEAWHYEMQDGMAFANVTDYLSIRREPSGDSTRLGLMNNGDSCIVISVEGEWAYVKSGAVKGYCLVKHLIQGREAETYAKEHVVYTATIIGNVNVRSTPTTQEDNIVSYLSIGDVVTAKTPAVRCDNDPTTPLFAEVIYNKDGATGYIALNLAEITYSWPVARAIDDRKEQ